MKIRTLATAAFVWFATGAVPNASAQEYPAKPIRLIIPVPVGGGIDAIARLLSQHLREQLGQPIIVENRPGAGGNIAMSALQHAAPDGYSLALVPSTPTLNHTLYKNLGFDLLKDFKPVALVANNGPSAIAGRATLPISSLDELVKYARDNPAKLTYAGCDTGSSFHLAGELFKKENGIDLIHVPFKGCSDVMPNLLGGHIDLAFIPLANIDAYTKNGQVKAYAVANDKRTRFAPSLPTTFEQGYPLTIKAWYGVLAPGKTPDAVIDRLNKAINQVLAQPSMKDGLAQIFVEPAGGSRASFDQLIRQEIKLYEGVIKATKVDIAQ